MWQGVYTETLKKHECYAVFWEGSHCKLHEEWVYLVHHQNLGLGTQLALSKYLLNEQEECSVCVSLMRFLAKATSGRGLLVLNFIEQSLNVELLNNAHGGAWVAQ